MVLNPHHPNPADRDNARRWARELLALPNFYVLDTETTGVDLQAEVVQIGVVDKDGRTVLETLVRPTRPIPPDVQAVHGISDAMVQDKPTFADLYAQLASLLAGMVLVAYNMDFDWRILQQSGTPYGLPALRPKALHCAMKQYAAFWGHKKLGYADYRWHKLGEAAAQQGIVVRDAHSALGDVRMTLALIRKMAE
ncbi:MAG: 3'-5' exonuclease [Anaerolineae bacterium]|nr:3'-5' exonuclease [Anaerolineae bacterium]MDW8172252.1 3'-5' exonuclease [Anaerolineae bacterium]